MSEVLAICAHCQKTAPLWTAKEEVNFDTGKTTLWRTARMLVRADKVDLDPPQIAVRISIDAEVIRSENPDLLIQDVAKQVVSAMMQAASRK